ncbi:MAG TPA: DUF2141 domain-containing protein [Acidobacteriaceae bacterium]|nr:DUF2141 domain-containing protein [Acidobacteriaceae bacterium]
MKSIFMAAMLLVFPAANALADAVPAKCGVKVHATGFRNQKGTADAAVFTSPNGWPEGNKEYVHDTAPISGNQATISFLLPPGEYSVVVLHDENENYKLDRDFLGWPKEGFGFSNNPRVLLTAPTFQQAEFKVGCPATDIDVKIIYK